MNANENIDRKIEDEVARQIMKSPSPRWFKVLQALMGLLALALFALAFWMKVHPEKWAKLLDEYGITHTQPLFVGVITMVIMVVLLTFHRRLAETQTTVKWWLMIFIRRCLTTTNRLRLPGRKGKILWTVVFTKLFMVYQQVKAGGLLFCILSLAVVGGTIIVIYACDPYTYLVCEVLENGLPVRGSWRISEATPKTLAASDERRAEGAFKRGDKDATRRAEINNAWDAENLDQLHYPYPIGPLSATPRARVIAERANLPGLGPRAENQRQVAVSRENVRFVQLSSWSLTNAISMASEEYTRRRPELGGMNIAQWINEATDTGTLTKSTNQSDFFKVRSEEVVLCDIKTSSFPKDWGLTDGGGTINSGESVTVTATPAPGCTFTSWTDQGVVISTNATCTFTVATNLNLVANFAK